MFWGSVSEDFAQQANVNGSHSAILSALREHVLKSLRSRWDHVCNERSNPDRRSLQYFKRSHIAEVVFFTIWSGMCVITIVGCWVPSLQCIGFEPCKMVFKASNWFKNLSFSPKYLTIPKGNSPLEPSWWSSTCCVFLFDECCWHICIHLVIFFPRDLVRHLIHCSLAKVHGSWAQHFEQLRWQFFVQTKAVGQTFNTKLAWWFWAAKAYVMPFWCGLFSERCCKVAWSMVFMLFQNDKFDAAVISRKCLGCRKLGPCYPGSTTAPWQTRQRFW